MVKDPFVIKEWADLCQRLKNSAQKLGDRANQRDTFSQQAIEFCNSDPPENYVGLLQRVGDAADFAKRWQDAKPEKMPMPQSAIDEALDESFPASDPPAWTSSTL